MTKDTSIKFCSNCGSRLVKVVTPAHKLKTCNGGYDFFPLGKKFNSETGKRQYGILVKCKNKRWWNCCDKWSEGELIQK